MTGEVTNPSGIDSTALSAGVWLLRDDPTFMFPAATNFGDLFAIAVSLPVEDFWIAEESMTNPSVNLSTVIDVDPISIEFTQQDIDDGLTEFYVLTALAGAATGGPGNSVNTFSTTLSLDFDTSELLVASVPIPPAVWLFGSALVGLGGLGRRHA